MPAHPRNPDYLRRHMDMALRVSNLETGVHPTTAATQYWDSTDWTWIFLSNTDDFAPDGIYQGFSFRFQWRRRLGIVYLAGGIRPFYFVLKGYPAQTGTDPEGNPIDLPARPPIGPEGAKIATLPTDARPDNLLRVAVTAPAAPPYVIPGEIHPNGNIWIFPEDLPENYHDGPLLFNGIQWPVG